MARGKSVIKTYGRGKNGKLQLKSKTVQKTTNQTKGAGVQSVLTSEKGKLAARKIQSNENIAKAKILGRSADIANIANQVGSTVRQGLGNKPVTSTAIEKINTGAGLDQVINGGAGIASNSRDDDEDNPWVE